MTRKSIISTLLIAGALALGASHPVTAAGKTTFKVRIDDISGATASTVKYIGVFNKPLGALQPGAAVPGQSFEFTVSAVAGDHLSFTTMFGASNDWFFAPDEKGIALYDASGKPVSGDFSSAVKIWDAGTMIDEEPGMVSHKAAAENGKVRPIDASEAKITVPEGMGYIKLTITSLSNNLFRVRLDNTSGNLPKPTPISPGTYIIHTGDAPVFTSGTADRGQGLQQQAQMGNPVLLARAIGSTDKTAHLSPGVFVIHTAADPLFTVGQPDRGQGLQPLAEMGKASILGDALKASGKFATTGVFDTAVGASKAGPIGPGGAFEFSFDAQPGDYLSFATMFGDSSDSFFAPDGNGIALYNAKGQPVMGDVSIFVQLWDVGTMTNEAPFTASHKSPAEKYPVQLLSDRNDGYAYPSTLGMIKVSITADNGSGMDMLQPAPMPGNAATMAPAMAATMSK
jgi:hypothetical protein